VYFFSSMPFIITAYCHYVKAGSIIKIFLKIIWDNSIERL
jgi:hypothetical protein